MGVREAGRDWRRNGEWGGTGGGREEGMEGGVGEGKC